MWNRQSGLVHGFVPVQEQVEIDRAGAEARAPAPDAAEPALDREQALEQLAG